MHCHVPKSAKWLNVLVLAELLSALPASNGKLERVFSTLGMIKVDKRSRLSNQSLDDLLLLNSAKLLVADFHPDASIDLWWSSKSRKPFQKERKEYRQCGSDQPTSSAAGDVGCKDHSESEEGDMLECWDELIKIEINSDSDKPF